MTAPGEPVLRQGDGQPHLGAALRPRVRQPGRRHARRRTTPTHPELLDALAKEFAASGFDVKYLIRAICNSQTYQRTSKPAAGNKADDRAVQPHGGEGDVAGAAVRQPGAGDRATGKADGRRPQAASGRRAAGRPRATSSCSSSSPGPRAPTPTEYEAGIPQALRLMNSPDRRQPGRGPADRRRRRRSRRRRSRRSTSTALSRRPTAEERSTADRVRRQGRHRRRRPTATSCGPC